MCRPRSSSFPIIFALVIALAGPLSGAQVRSAKEAPPPREQSEGFRRFVYVTIATGANWPVDDMNVAFDADVLFLTRGEYAFSPLKRVGAQLGFHSFDSEQASTRDNAEIVSLSVFGKALGIWGPYRPFGLLGVGAYLSKQEDSSRRLDGGFEIGGGIELPASSYLSATAGTGLHVVFRGDRLNDLLWLDGYIGFLFRAP